MAAQLSPTQNSTVELEVEREERERKTELNRIANEAENVGFDSGKGFLHLQRVAQVFASSDMVPKQFQRNLSNCCIAVNLARRLNADELMVMQNLYIVYGRPGWSSKFKIAMFNQTGRFTPVAYQFFGTKGKDDYGCRAVCTNKATGESIIGPDITIGLAKAEGWYDRKSKDGGAASKWPTMPDLMLRYRAASWMIDTTAPELTMGIGTLEEHIDTGELLEAAIEETQRRYDDKNRNMPPAYPGPVAVEAETAKEMPIPEPAKTPTAAPAQTPKQTSKPKANQATAPATSAGSPTYQDGFDPDPAQDPYQREPGQDG